MDLTEQLIRDEGVRLRRYPDSLGNPTIGVGHLLCEGDPLCDVECITHEKAAEVLNADIGKAKRALKKALPWVDNLEPVRRAVLENMWFNMGARLLGFRRMLGFAQSGLYTAAAAEMENSAWAKQVGDRATRLAEQMKTALWQ